MGKFLAAWAFAGIALALTFPFWITVNILGQPDNGVILASYIGSFLMAGAFLAIGAALSALTKNQVIAFVLTAARVLPLHGQRLDRSCWASSPAGRPRRLLTCGRRSSASSTHFSAIVRGVIDLRDAVFFLSVIALFLFANAIVVELKKAD